MDTFPESILIVDDDRELAETVSDIVSNVISHLGVKIFQAFDSVMALEIINKEKIFLLFCDYRLEKMKNGIELYQEAKEQNPLLEMILITGYAEKKMAIDAIRLGVKDIIEKPFDHKNLAKIALTYTQKRLTAWEQERQELELIKQCFIEETNNSLADIEPLILGLEEGKPEEKHAKIDKIYRIIHTIKGSCGAASNNKNILELTHKLESVLSIFREDKELSPELIIELLLTSTDYLKGLISQINNPDVSIEGLEEQLQKIDSTLCALNQNPENIKTTLKKVNHKTSTINTLSEASNCEFDILVSPQKLDELMETSGEMIAFKNNFEEIINKLSHKLPEENTILSDLNKALSEISNSLQQKILAVRKVKCARIASSLPRVIRKLAQDLQKEITFTSSGMEIEIDKSIAHCLNTSLIHIVRNACDHGIETPTERRELGKKCSGTISLSVQEQGEWIKVSILDDGRGLNKIKIINKAIESNILSHENAQALTDSEAYQLIFLPGFSTNKEVSDISGRGVGMDAVKNAVTEMNGKIEIFTECGKYTNIVLYIPKQKTVLIDKLAICTSSNFLFGIPNIAVEKIVSIEERNRINVNNRYMYAYEGELIPLGSYRNLIEKNNLPDIQENIETAKEQLLAIISSKNKKIALQIEELHTQINSVIKPFPQHTCDFFNIYKGVALLPENKIALVIDNELLIQHSYAKKI